jgi:hypothetical protein
MIWSSRARNRSPDLVVSGLFGRIVLPPMRQQNHASQKKGISKMKLQGLAASGPKTLQSQTCPYAGNRLLLNALAVVHGRLPSCLDCSIVQYLRKAIAEAVLSET